MSAQPSFLANSNPLRCFKLHIELRSVLPTWFTTWQQQLLSEMFMISSCHEEALARLIPLLLCGEQSAIHVFSREVERLRGTPWSNSIALLKDIESDEYVHEQALQTLSSLLMQPADLCLIKRKARHFYLKIGSTVGVTEHFARVSLLDTCVCKIMNAITQCDLGKRHLITQLFDRIKKDEARHVSVSRKHFQRLGGDRALFTQSKDIVNSQLVSLLRTEANSFETLGIDPDVLFRKLERV